MSVDFATLGISLDSRPIAEGTKALDALADASVRVEQKVRVSNGQMGDTAKIMQYQAEQAKAAAAANAVLGTGTAQLTLGQQYLNDKFKEQAATIGMSRSQLMAYQSAQMGLTTETAKAIATVRAHEDAIKAAAKAKEEAAMASNRLHEAIKLLAGAYTLLKITEYVKDTAMLNARYEELGVVMRVVGANAGYSAKQMEDYATGVQKQGISMLESRQSIIKLTQAHIDLSHASELARGAQDAAVIGGINSSEAFERMVNGIARGNVLILRNLGINVNLQTAYENMASSLGVATKELSENERVEARRIAVQERLLDLSGTYTAAMDTAAKQIRSTTRYIEDLKTIQGEVFNEALTVAVMAFTDRLKDAGGAAVDLKTNGSLKDWGSDVASTLGFLADSAMTVTAIFRLLGNSIGGLAALAAASGQAERNTVQAAYAGQEKNILGTVTMFRDAMAQRRKAVVDGAAERLNLEKNYAVNALIVQKAYADQSAEIQKKAQRDLAAGSGQATAAFLGGNSGDDRRPTKDKIDQAENTRMADHLKRIETETNAEKAASEYMMRIDEMRHKAGEMGDAAYYERRRGYVDEIAGAEEDGYNKQLAELQKHYSHTKEEAEKNTKAIHDVEDKFAAARSKYAYDDLVRDEEERLRKDAIINAAVTASTKEITSINAQVAAVEMQIRTYGMLPAAKTAVMIADLEEQAAALVGFDNSQKTIDLINEKIEALNRLRVAQGKSSAQEQGSDITKAKELLEILTAVDAAARDAAAGMAASFGAVGSAIGGLTTAMTGYSRAQATVAGQLAIAIDKAHGDQAKIQQANAVAATQSAQAQIKSYGDMAGAAKGFFKENSAGYKVMEGAEKAFRAYEMAMAVESMVKKIFFKEGEVAASLALNGTKLTGEAATTAASTGLAATEASAWGITAVVKALASLPFPANLAAGAATLAAVVAIGAKLVGGIGGGSGGGKSAADVQKAQGTGSVFGDIGIKNAATGALEYAAKSDSIARSIALSAANSNIELTHTAGMLAALKNIEASMAGLTNLIVRAPGVIDGSNMGIYTGQLNKGQATDGVSRVMTEVTKGLFGPGLGDKISGFINNLWGKTTQNIVDSGLQFGGSVRDLQGGKGYDQYASVDTTKSSWFGLSKSTSNSVQTQGLGNELSSQFGLIFTNLEASLKIAATGVGIGADQVTKALDGLTIDTTKISLKGLTGDALTAAINGVISKTMDQMAEAAFPAFDQFRKVGEGYAETVIRVTTNYSKLDSILASAGMTFGAVGVASLGAREKLIDLAGGIDKLTTQTASFSTNFLSQAEQLAPVQKYVTEQLAAMGLAWVDTRDKLKNVVLGLDLTSAAEQQRYVDLMNLTDAFAKTHAAEEDLTKSAQGIADERTRLQDEYDKLTTNSVQLRNKERLSIDKTNLSLFDSITAEQEKAAMIETSNNLLNIQSQIYALTGNNAGAAAVLQKQHAAALAAMEPALRGATQQLWDLQAAAAQKATWQSFGDALVGSMNNATAAAKALRAFNDSLKLGNLSPLSKDAQYDIAKKQYAVAGPGDQAAATAFLQASQARGGSKFDYASDFAMVIANNSAAATAKDNQAAAIPGLWRSLLDSGAIGAHANGGVASGWSLVGEHGPELANFTQPARIYTAGQTQSIMGGNGNAELKAEIRQMRTELNAALQAIALNTSSGARHSKRTSDTLQMVTRDGTALVTTTKL